MITMLVLGSSGPATCGAKTRPIAPLTLRGYIAALQERVLGPSGELPRPLAWSDLRETIRFTL
jgi:hypothetical protein